jgi:methyl-accepting chemotaxis protein
VIETGEFGMADFAPYAPSENEPAAFLARPVLRKNRLEYIIGLQLSIESINKIMMQRTGLGKTGETYLVGGDMLMRSDAFLDPVNRSIRASFAKPQAGRVDTEASRNALAGETGERIIKDYNGNPVLSAYTPITLWDVNWALIAEMDVEEAFTPIHRLGWLISMVAVISILSVVTTSLLIVLLFLNRPVRPSPE